jgi:hypothetical protein
MFNLAQYPIFEKDFIRQLARDGYFRAHPEILGEFHRALFESYWYEPVPWMTGKEYHDVLDGQLSALTAEREYLESRLARIEGKRLYKLYKKFTALLSGAT